MLRPDEDGLTIVGDRVAARYPDLAALDRTLDAVPIHPPPYDVLARRPPLDCRVVTYRLLDHATGAPVTPFVDRTVHGVEFPADGLDGESLRGAVVRQRWLTPRRG